MLISGSGPAILVPYQGPCIHDNCQDIFIYLRPETNGVEVESTILKQIEHHPQYRKKISLVYLANIPGNFMIQRHIVERYYSVKFFFSVHGKQAFTPWMRKRFEEHFGVPFETADILGSFEALKALGLSTGELFDHWVDPAELLIVNDQTIKKMGRWYIVNCDLPDLMHRNNRNTDIAVMIFRISFGFDEFLALVDEMCRALQGEGRLERHQPVTRIFHYSRSPFGQLLDAVSYLYGADGERIPLERVSFCSFLLDQGLPLPAIAGALNHPLMTFRDADGRRSERSIFYATEHTTYEQAFRILLSAETQYLIPRTPA